MKACKTLLMLLAVLAATVALIGCGVNKDEHEKAVSELNTTKAALEQANAKIARLETSLKEAPAAMEKPTAIDSGMQEKLASAQQEASDLRGKVASLTNENSRLQGQLENLKAQLSDLQKKFEGLQSPSKEVPSDILKR
jgi:chromosome segregation ATPase